MGSYVRIGLLLCGFVAMSGCSRFCSRKQTAPSPDARQEEGAPATKVPNYAGITVSNTVKREMAIGKGSVAKDGSAVLVKYEEYVYDPAALGNMGPKISESKEGPVKMKIGEGKFIKGFEEGLKGMAKGGKRQLIIPAAEAYGDTGKPPEVPGKVMVMIDVELVDVK
jgi:FKBP-type peptidyl-prolyl cis-trans isomerase FkpA